MTDQQLKPTACSVCGTEGTGRFCANCGATLASGKCTACGASLSPGAHYCHRCGKPVGAATSATEPATAAAPMGTAAPGRSSSSVPWIVAGVALLALLAMSAGKFFSSSKTTSPDTSATATGNDAGGVRAPDISSLSPEERADRLFNRVMLLSRQGKTDSVLFFAPMAINAYQMLSPMNAGQRYEMGRVAEVAGALEVAKAQADTILSATPNHLLGLALGARIASLSGDSTARRQYQSKLVSAEKTELKKNLPEYDRHKDDITAALADARPANR